ncbi:helix-turn-helix transcriptional regulator [Kitasatospora sp. NPDC048298]|uniref:helix-turn-helix transcriptional regulator n=1 Tax=Kitasatospora sp. NPDC048298 TaxID=3364049 RepID=UPI00371CD892
MDRDWARLSSAIAAARDDLELTQPQLAKELGVGRSAVQKLESGHQYSKVTPLHRAAARRFGWTEDSVEAVLAGGAPTVRGQHGDAAPKADIEDSEVDELLDDLTGRVRAALLGGKVADATAIALDTADEGDVVIIWKEGEARDLTPEERRELEKKWSRLQRAAHEIFSEGDTQ